MFDRTQDGESVELVPRRIVIEQANELGVDISERLDRWAEKGIAPKSRSIPYSPERGYRADEVDHILAIVRIVKQLGDEHTRSSEIAFWLAYEGRIVPSNLVLDHVESSVRKVITGFKTLLNSRGRGMCATDEEPELLENPMVKMLLKMLGLVSYHGPFRDALEIGVVLGLRALFRRARPKDPRDALSKMTSFFVKSDATMEERDKAGAALWAAFKECASLVDLDPNHNRLIIAAQAAKHEKPVIALRAVTDVKSFIDVAASVLPWCRDVGNLERVTEGPNDINRWLPPAMAGVLLSVLGDPAAQARIIEMREGRTDSIISDLTQLRIVGEQIAAMRTDPNTSA